jgi:CBS domain containing-hemolysin-like protein
MDIWCRLVCNNHGQVGLPMVAQALTPLLSGYMIAHFSVKKFVSLLVVLAFINIITMVVLRNKILNKSRVLSV